MYRPNIRKSTSLELEKSLSFIDDEDTFSTPGGIFYYSESPLFPSLTIGRLEVLAFKGHKIPFRLETMCRELVSDFLLTPEKCHALHESIPSYLIGRLCYYMTPICSYISVDEDSKKRIHL